MKIDPICHMEVEEATALTTEADGATVYFCSEGCKDRFLADEGVRLTRTTYDLVIIGGGPAGLTAAVYASTLKMDVLLIAGDLGGQAIDSRKIVNYMGFDFITGPELVEKFRDQLLHSHYVEHLITVVERLEPAGGGFVVTTAEAERFTTRAVLFATGMTRRRLGVEGEERLQRRGLFYGNVQDLSFVQGKAVVVVGGGNSALQMVESLDRIASAIAVVSDTELTGDPAVVERVREQARVTLYEGYKVAAFHGEERLRGFTLRRIGTREVREMPADGAFIAIGFEPNTALVRGLVEINGRGEIHVGPDCATTRPGIFAAGDCTDAFGKRIIIASGEGAKAALAARQHILQLRREAKDHVAGNGGPSAPGIRG